MTEPRDPEAFKKALVVGTISGPVRASTTKTGKKVTNFKVQAGRSGLQRVVAWEELADRAGSLVNGARVLVEGREERKKFDGKEGEVWYSEIVASTIELLDEPPSF